jgi:UDP-N-acetylmuramoylalanine--D-glutamate ligase
MSTIEQLVSQGSVDMNHNAMLFNERLLYARHQHIREIMSDYWHVASRMEHVATVCGIDFINDAKADNLNAAWYSLENMTKPVIWIVNNVKTSEGFDKIARLLRKKVKAVILLGHTDNVPSIFSNYIESVYKASSIEHAVELAYTVGFQGDAVLFSPAAGEYNEDHEQTGRLFSAAVKRL